MSGEKTIAAALVAAQLEMTKAKKASVNPHFKSSYADLSSVMDACLPALNKHGIAVYQPFSEDETGKYVRTVFLHAETGESLECRIPLLVEGANMQKLGSAITYARRYGLMAMAGIAPDDDDGNAASIKPNPTQPTIEQPPAPISDKTIETLLGIAESINAFPSQDVFREWIEVTCKSNLGGLSEKSGQKIIRFLTESPDVSQWGEQYVNALTTAMKNQGVDDEPG